MKSATLNRSVSRRSVPLPFLAALLFIVVSGSFPAAVISAADVAEGLNAGSDSPDTRVWSGFSFQGLAGSVEAMVEHDGRLIVAGNLWHAGLINARSVIAWDGAAWQDLGSPWLDGRARMTTFEGDVILATSHGEMLRWNGEAWTSLGIRASDVGVYRGYLVAAGYPGVQFWNGSDWLRLGNLNFGVSVMSVRNDRIIAGGESHVALWDGLSWTEPGNASNWDITAVTFDGADPIAAGMIEGAGEESPRCRIARWNGADWVPLGSGMNGPVDVLSVHDGRILAGGSFTESDGRPCASIAEWDGTAWRDVDGGINGHVAAVTPFQGRLVAAGEFSKAGGRSAGSLAVLETGGWSRLPRESFAFGLDAPVHALKSFGGDLIAGGSFLKAGDEAAAFIAAWNGTSWREIGNGFDDAVFTLGTYRGELIAGGDFTTSGDTEVRHVARWDGSAWQPMGSGLNDRVLALQEWNGSLVAGGWFTEAGGVAALHIARWDGTTWQPMGDGFDGDVMSLFVFGNGTFENRLVAGGVFRRSGNAPIDYLAFWETPTSLSPRWSPMGEVDTPILTMSNVFGSLVAGGLHRGNRRGPYWWWQPRQTSGAWGTYGDIVGWVNAVGSFGEWAVAAGTFNAGTVLYRRGGGAWQPLFPGRNGVVNAIAEHDGALFAGGTFDEMGGWPSKNIARFDPTPEGISLAALSGERRDSGIVIEWSVLDSPDHAAFDVYRALRDAPWEKINAHPLVGPDLSFVDASPPSEEVAYWIVESGRTGFPIWYGPVIVAEAPEVSPPPVFILNPNVPNPFRQVTTFSFSLPAPGRVRIRVYDLKGALTAVIVDGDRPAGAQSVEWDGRDLTGQAVASGVYLLRMEAAGQVRTMKVLRAR